MSLPSGCLWFSITSQCNRRIDLSALCRNAHPWLEEMCQPAQHTIVTWRNVLTSTARNRDLKKCANQHSMHSWLEEMCQPAQHAIVTWRNVPTSTAHNRDLKKCANQHNTHSWLEEMCQPAQHAIVTWRNVPTSTAHNRDLKKCANQHSTHPVDLVSNVTAKSSRQPTMFCSSWFSSILLFYFITRLCEFLPTERSYTSK
jgi:glutamate synthase domain-containing protein 1